MSMLRVVLPRLAEFGESNGNRLEREVITKIRNVGTGKLMTRGLIRATRSRQDETSLGVGTTGQAEDPSEYRSPGLSLGLSLSLINSVYLPALDDADPQNSIAVRPESRESKIPIPCVGTWSKQAGRLRPASLFPEIFSDEESLSNSNSRIDPVLTIAGQDLKLSRAKGGRTYRSPETSVPPPPTPMSPYDRDSPILEEELRKLLLCQSMGIKIEISRKGDFRSGILAVPVFHCPRCLRHWNKYGKPLEDCKEPNQPIKGPEFQLPAQSRVILTKFATLPRVEQQSIIKAMDEASPSPILDEDSSTEDLIQIDDLTEDMTSSPFNGLGSTLTARKASIDVKSSNNQTGSSIQDLVKREQRDSQLSSDKSSHRIKSRKKGHKPVGKFELGSSKGPFLRQVGPDVRQVGPDGGYYNTESIFVPTDRLNENGTTEKMVRGPDQLLYGDGYDQNGVLRTDQQDGHPIGLNFQTSWDLQSGRKGTDLNENDCLFKANHQFLNDSTDFQQFSNIPRKFWPTQAEMEVMIPNPLQGGTDEVKGPYLDKYPDNFYERKEMGTMNKMIEELCILKNSDKSDGQTCNDSTNPNQLPFVPNITVSSNGIKEIYNEKDFYSQYARKGLKLMKPHPSQTAEIQKGSAVDCLAIDYSPDSDLYSEMSIDVDGSSKDKQSHTRKKKANKHRNSAKSINSSEESHKRLLDESDMQIDLFEGSDGEFPSNENLVKNSTIENFFTSGHTYDADSSMRSSLEELLQQTSRTEDETVITKCDSDVELIPLSQCNSKCSINKIHQAKYSDNNLKGDQMDNQKEPPILMPDDNSSKQDKDLNDKKNAEMNIKKETQSHSAKSFTGVLKNTIGPDGSSFYDNFSSIKHGSKVEKEPSGKQQGTTVKRESIDDKAQIKNPAVRNVTGRPDTKAGTLQKHMMATPKAFLAQNTGLSVSAKMSKGENITKGNQEENEQENMRSTARGKQEQEDFMQDKNVEEVLKEKLPLVSDSNLVDENYSTEKDVSVRGGKNRKKIVKKENLPPVRDKKRVQPRGETVAENGNDNPPEKDPGFEDEVDTNHAAIPNNESSNQIKSLTNSTLIASRQNEFPNTFNTHNDSSLNFAEKRDILNTKSPSPLPNYFNFALNAGFSKPPPPQATFRMTYSTLPSFLGTNSSFSNLKTGQKSSETFSLIANSSKESSCDMQLSHVTVDGQETLTHLGLVASGNKKKLSNENLEEPEKEIWKSVSEMWQKHKAELNKFQTMESFSHIPITHAFTYSTFVLPEQYKRHNRKIHEKATTLKYLKSLPNMKIKGKTTRPMTAELDRLLEEKRQLLPGKESIIQKMILLEKSGIKAGIFKKL